MATQSRLHELDSLRGLAALTVFLLHVKLIFPSGNMLSNMFDYGPLRIFIVGQEAVILFFVLSGFVLSMPYNEGKKVPYSTYVIRRFCRIYIPYFVTIVLSVAAKQLLFNGYIPTLNSWFNSFWYASVTPRILFEHVFMVKAFGSNLNPILWSLVYEMRISLLFPFILLALRYASFRQSFFAALACSLISVLIVYLFHPSELATDYLYTIHYSALFILGAAVSKNREYLISRLSALPNVARALTIAVVMLLFIYTYEPNSIFFRGTSDWVIFFMTVLRNWVVAGGAVLLIILALWSARFKRFLNLKPIAFLGKISYSLYLIHFVLFLAVLRLLHDKMPLGLIVAITLVLGTAAAALMYYLVERPAMKLGKMLTGGNKWGQSTDRKSEIMIPEKIEG